MQIDEEGRFVRPPMTDAANPWSLLEYRAHDRMSELAVETQRERLAGLARISRSSGPKWPRLRVVATMTAAARSALAMFARQLSPGPG